MTYPEAIQFLYDLRWFGAKLGLENTHKLADLAGRPQRRLRFIHVAGTNGKGSTCAMLEAIYRAAGFRVGLFTSPHLVAFGERIQVNRQPISETDVVRLVEQLKPLIATFPVEQHPTFFEVVTVMALLYFAEQGCELVIWETGLGGRLDATNIVTPMASVITNIQYDHQKWLGETLASIASEKAGIIKPGVPVVTAAVALEALKVIEQTASSQFCPLTRVTAADAQGLKVSLLGEHQKMNAAVAVATVRILDVLLPVPAGTVREALAHVRWAGRLQLVKRPGGRRILLDGAHNVGGAEMLVAALQASFRGHKPAMILGILRDKDWASMCQVLAPRASRILLVPVHSERTAEPHGLAEVCHKANPDVAVLECASLDEAFVATENDPFVTVAGSLYLIGEAMELLHITPDRQRSERQLNEWGGTPGR
jgi:dihydrofolate synthase/folylpolyglutamate synthase